MLWNFAKRIPYGNAFGISLREELYHSLLVVDIVLLVLSPSHGGMDR